MVSKRIFWPKKIFQKIKKPKIVMFKTCNQKETYYSQNKTKYNWNIAIYRQKDSQKISLLIIETLIQEYWLNLIKILSHLPESTPRTYPPKETNPKNLLKSKDPIINHYELNILKKENPLLKINQFKAITFKESPSCLTSWNLTRPKIFSTKATWKSEDLMSKKELNLEALLQKSITKMSTLILNHLKESSEKWT